MVIIVYVALAFFLFWGVKFSKKKSWNEELMSFDHTKCFLGFCAVIVVLHHCSQWTCAPWLPQNFIRPGLDIFVTAGYPMVGMFFFFSGFGLYKSSKTKPDFFNNFIISRFVPVLIPTALTFIVYVLIMKWRHVPFTIDHPLQVNDHSTWHPFIWYIPCMLLTYLLFYIGFGLIKKDWAGILIVALGTLGYIAFCIKFQYGTWWFNTMHMFLIGILVAKYEKKFFESCKKLWILRLIGTIILCVVFSFLGDNAGGIWLMTTGRDYAMFAYQHDLICLIFQVLYTLSFMSLYYLVAMKVKVGNPVLRFFGKFTLELYLVHGIFVNMFGFYMLNYGIRPVHYIANVPLYVLVVLAISVPISYGLCLVDKKVGKLLRPKKT